MTASTEYTEYVLEHLAVVDAVSTSRFFGGVGLSLGAAQFAMVMGNSLYFVVDDSTRAKYEAAGMAPFSYTTKNGRVTVRRYFELPEEVLNDPDVLRQWARESIQIAEKKRPASKRGVKKSARRVKGKPKQLIRK